MIEFVLTLAVMMLAQGGRDELSRAVQDAFTANQAAFEAGEARFRYIKGTAASPEAARAGAFDPHYEADGRFAFKGEKAYYERLFAEADMLSTSKSVGNGQTVTILHSIRMATDGKTTLLDWISANPKDKATHSVRLEPGAESFDRDFHFPIAMARPDCGWGSPRTTLRAAFDRLPGVKISTVDREAVFEGRSVVRIVVEHEAGSAEFWIDLERGAIPLKIVERTVPGGDFPESTLTTFHDDIRHIEGAGWLPFEQSWWGDRSGDGGRIVILDARFTEPPDAALTMEFDEPIGVVDQSRGLTYAVKKSWDVSKLPAPGSRGVAKLPAPTFIPEDIPTLPGEQEAGHGSGLLLAGLLTLAVAGALIWARSRRRAA